MITTQMVGAFKPIEGIFLRELKNRFLCEVEIDDTPTICYVPSSCHLGNFLQLKGKQVLLIKNQGEKTRTKYALFAMPYKRSYILLSPATANQAVALSLKSRRFSFLGSRQRFQPEYTIDGYKADLYIEDTHTIVEIKAVITTQASAVFPTVFSERTLKQLTALDQRLNSGQRACMLIISLSPYVQTLQINTKTEFFEKLRCCIDKGLILRSFCCRYDPKEGIKIDKSIPIDYEGKGALSG